MMVVLITGASGFIGKNLELALRRNPHIIVYTTDLDTPEDELERGLAISDVVFHLAGINRPPHDKDFEPGNVGPLAHLLRNLEKYERTPLIVFASSVQALLDNPYGRSKRHAEELLLDYASKTGTGARIFRLPGVFGKWCRPYYNSVVATLCYNATRNLPLEISDPIKRIELVHVDDVVKAFIDLTKSEEKGASFCEVIPTFWVTLGRLAEMIVEMKKGRDSFDLGDLSDPFMSRLYGTFMSYLPPDAFCADPEVKADGRGFLAELFKAGGHGQVFVSVTKPGVTRGNHYHDAKVEKFAVLQGDAVIRFRHMATGEGVRYDISGKKLCIVDIPPGWTHSIENVGSTEMTVLFWSSEVFDPARPDTFIAEASI